MTKYLVFTEEQFEAGIAELATLSFHGGFLARREIGDPVAVLDELPSPDGPGPLDELRALSDAARPGPWRPYFTIHGDPYVLAGDHYPQDQVAAVPTGPADYGRADAEFIAAAVNHARALLAAPARPVPLDVTALPEWDALVEAFTTPVRSTLRPNVERAGNITTAAQALIEAVNHG